MISSSTGDRLRFNDKIMKYCMQEASVLLRKYETIHRDSAVAATLSKRVCEILKKTFQMPLRSDLKNGKKTEFWADRMKEELKAAICDKSSETGRFLQKELGLKTQRPDIDWENQRPTTVKMKEVVGKEEQGSSEGRKLGGRPANQTCCDPATQLVKEGSKQTRAVCSYDGRATPEERAAQKQCVEAAARGLMSDLKERVACAGATISAGEGAEVEEVEDSSAARAQPQPEEDAPIFPKQLDVGLAWSYYVVPNTGDHEQRGGQDRGTAGAAKASEKLRHQEHPDEEDFCIEGSERGYARSSFGGSSVMSASLPSVTASWAFADNDEEGASEAETQDDLMGFEHVEFEVGEGGSGVAAGEQDNAARTDRDTVRDAME
eukprot:g15435.t1